MTQRTTRPCRGPALNQEAKLFDSGFQCFLEQLDPQPRTADELARLAFYAGAALLWRSALQFTDPTEYPEEIGRKFTDAMVDEIREFLEARRIQIAWSPREPLP